MTILVAAVLLGVLGLFWVCFGLFWVCSGGELKETGTREQRPGREARPGSIENPLVVVRTSPDPLILPPGFTFHIWDWRAEQIAPGVSRCPSDPENEQTYGA